MLLLLFACDSKPAESESTAATTSETGKPVVVATTTMIADLARAIGGDAVEVVGIMKTGEDPHVYDVRPRDAQAVADADLVLMNGYHLEATLADVVDHNASGRVLRVAEVAVNDPIDPGQGAPDPHVWMDAKLWSLCAMAVSEALSDLAPDRAADIRQRGQAHIDEILAIDTFVRESLASVPEDQRVIVTSHDAFNYYARAYGVEVHGVIGISTDQQPRPQDVAALVDLVNERGVRAVFIETSVADTLNQIVHKVADDTGVVVGGKLYSDSLGEPGTDAGTWLGMMRHNTTTIAEALKGGSTSGE